MRITQKEAAQRIGVDCSTLAWWEQGVRVPEGRYAALVAEFLRGRVLESEQQRRVG